MKSLKEYYAARFDKFGVHENSLGWTKGKQAVRYYGLTKEFCFEGKSILDVGCGFGDLKRYLMEKNISLKQYTGIDMIENFIKTAKMNFPESEKDFIVTNYMDQKFISYDYIIASGLFGKQIYTQEEENYNYIETVIQKACLEANLAVSFDFLSDKVDYRTSDEDFHANPSRILDIAYKYSRNVILNNSIMPFEFYLTIFMNNTFDKSKTIFNAFLEKDHDVFG